MFRFDSILSTDKGLIVIRDNHLEIEERDIEIIKIPGKNGDLIFENGGKKNIKIDIECVLDATKENNLKEKVDALKRWLEKEGYRDLTFLDDNTTFKAFFIGALKPNLIFKNLCELTISFTCYKEGD